MDETPLNPVRVPSLECFCYVHFLLLALECSLDNTQMNYFGAGSPLVATIQGQHLFCSAPPEVYD